MYHTYAALRKDPHLDLSGNFQPANDGHLVEDEIKCSWSNLCSQLVSQWTRITIQELNEAGPYRRRIASIVQHKYDVEARLIENYLRNFERILPQAGAES